MSSDNERFDRRIELRHEWGSQTDERDFDEWLLDRVIALERYNYEQRRRADRLERELAGG